MPPPLAISTSAGQWARRRPGRRLRLLLQARLDAAFQFLDLGTAQAIIVSAGWGA